MKKISLILALVFVISSCKQSSKTSENINNKSYTPITNAEMENAVIYEVNIRQYSESATSAHPQDSPVSGLMGSMTSPFVFCV